MKQHKYWLVYKAFRMYGFNKQLTTVSIGFNSLDPIKSFLMDNKNIQEYAITETLLTEGMMKNTHFHSEQFKAEFQTHHQQRNDSDRV